MHFHGSWLLCSGYQRDYTPVHCLCHFRVRHHSCRCALPRSERGVAREIISEVQDLKTIGQNQSSQRRAAILCKAQAVAAHPVRTRGVNRRNHRPRTASTNASTDPYPRPVRLSLHRAFHSRRFSFLPSLRRTIMSCSTRKSTSESGPIPNLSLTLANPQSRRAPLAS